MNEVILDNSIVLPDGTRLSLNDAADYYELDAEERSNFNYESEEE